MMSRSGSFGQRPQVLLLCSFTLVRKPTSAKQDYVHHMVRLHWRSYSHPINLYPPPSPCYLFIVTNSSFWDPRQGAAYSQAIGVSAHPHPLSQAGAGELVPLLWPRRVVLQGHTQGGSPDFSEQVFFFSKLPSIKKSNNENTLHNELDTLHEPLSRAGHSNTTWTTTLFVETIRALLHFSLSLFLRSLHSLRHLRFHQPAKTKKNLHHTSKLGRSPNLLLFQSLPLLFPQKDECKIFLYSTKNSTRNLYIQQSEEYLERTSISKNGPIFPTQDYSVSHREK